VKPPNNGPLYAAGLYPKLCEVFRAHGYALAVHGSVASDFDLIAVPWCDEAGEPADVIAECLSKFAFDKFPSKDVPTSKPHSRCAYKLHLSFGDCALDISFTPRTGKWWSTTRKVTVIEDTGDAT
jgi:hypothetical protein